METLLWIVAILCVLVGIAGTVLPLLPGAPLVFLGLLIAAWINDFQQVGWPTLLVLALLAVLTFVVEMVAAAFGAKRVGASRLAIIGAFLGTIVGIVFGIPGVILGPFIGAAGGELIARPDLLRAGHVGLATWFGIIIGVAGKLAVVGAMIGVFILSSLL